MDTPVLGNSYTDPVTGFVGTCTGICTYLNSETRVQLEAKMTGPKLSRPEWFNASRVVATAPAT